MEDFVKDWEDEEERERERAAAGRHPPQSASRRRETLGSIAVNMSLLLLNPVFGINSMLPKPLANLDGMCSEIFKTACNRSN